MANTNRTVGTTLSHEVVKAWGERGLPDDTIVIRLDGSAGQSLGAWLANGVTIDLKGDANDYVGKGLSGGRIVIYPQKGTTFVPQDNVIVGNVVLYGATGGQAFFRGRAAERFAIRNSGASAVIEGLGDHGCEYMTGGRVVVLGPVGRNFAAGMSGGIAYVLADDRPAFATNCNQELVDLESIAGDREADDLRSLLEEHVRWTGSEVAAALIDNWSGSLSRFVRVIPRDYKRVLAERQSEDLAAPSAA